MTEETFRLTSSQSELKDKMQTFLDGPERIFLLTGKPGVGKTTMTKIMLASHIKSDKENKNSGSGNSNVVGIALSHKAKNVLGQHIPHVCTFAKAYGMKEVINNITGDRTFEIDKYNEDIVLGECNIPVFVHDEVSQYTQEMLKIVLDKTSTFSKIIFMGDKAQLPPIDPNNKMNPDEDSPVFKLEIPESCKHKLTERVRQEKGNPILELSDMIRDEIFGDKNIKKIIDKIKKPLINNDIGYNFLEYNDLLQHIEGKDYMNIALIGFRNKCINKFNPIIRNYLLKNPVNNIVVDDIICMSDSFYTTDKHGKKYCAFHNSDIFKITKVITTKKKFSTPKKSYYIDCFVAKTSASFEEEFITPTANGMIDFNNALEEIADMCKKYILPWKIFWSFKGYVCQWNYGYALTAYKCQGSTYQSVYVDINDILLTKPLTPKRKLQTLYTAITRASNDVYFLKGNTVK